MSHAYDEFLVQYKMTGSEKADGYSHSAFTGLSAEEKEMVFDLLISELPWEIKWLFFLNPEKAAIIAREKEAEQRGDRFTHVYMFQEQLVNQCRELVYQKHMIDDYKDYVDYLKPSVLRAIIRTPMNGSSINLFKQVILMEADQKLVAIASNYFLESTGFSRDTDVDRILYSRLLSDLESKDVARKATAIEYIFKKKKSTQFLFNSDWAENNKRF